MGSINTPSDIQNWTFSALAGEQIRLHINNETSTGLLYTLTGDKTYQEFADPETQLPRTDIVDPELAPRTTEEKLVALLRR